jgi:hypothetical protein
MDLWAAIYNAGTLDEGVLGVYSSEEAALKAAELASPGEADVEHYVLDETPDWVEGFAARHAADS